MTDQSWPADKTIEVAVLCPTVGEHLHMRGQITKVSDLKTTTPMALGGIGGPPPQSTNLSSTLQLITDYGLVSLQRNARDVQPIALATDFLVVLD